MEARKQAPQEKKKGEKLEKQIEAPPQIVENESAQESNGDLVHDEKVNGPIERNAGTGSGVQAGGAKSYATPMVAEARIPIEVEEE